MNVISIEFCIAVLMSLSALAIITFQDKKVRALLFKNWPVGLAICGGLILIDCVNKTDGEVSEAKMWQLFTFGAVSVFFFGGIFLISKQLPPDFRTIIWGGEFDEQMFERMSPDNLYHRVRTVAKEADTTACLSRNAYWALKIFQLVLACLVTCGIQLTGPQNKAAIMQLGPTLLSIQAQSSAVLGAIIVLVEALQQTAQFHQQWVVYRMCKERIIGEWQLFAASVNPYNDPKTRIQRISENIESIVRDTNIRWTKLESQGAGDGTAQPATQDVAEAISEFVPKGQLLPNREEQVANNPSGMNDTEYKRAFAVLTSECKKKALNNFLKSKGLAYSPTDFDLSKYSSLSSDAASIIDTLYYGLLNTIKNRLVLSSNTNNSINDLAAMSQTSWQDLLSKSESKNVINANAVSFYRGIFTIIDAIRSNRTNIEPAKMDIVTTAVATITANYFAFLFQHFDKELDAYIDKAKCDE